MSELSAAARQRLIFDLSFARIIRTIISISIFSRENKFSMPSPFSIATESSDGFAIISLDGAVDAHTAPKFEEAVQAVIEEGQFKIIVDCTKLTYISSAGLGVFMGFIEEVRDAEGDIKICGLSEKVKQPFEILGFETLYDFCPDVESSKKQFDEPVKGGF